MAPMMKDASDFWLLRHGERVDETDAGRAWKHFIAKERRFDPPLTRQGKLQARRAAEVLAEKNGVGFGRVFSSPLQRALETANEVAETLNIPVSVVPGLCECAAAVRKKGLGRLQLLDVDSMRKVCPRIDCFEEAPLEFDAACAWLAKRTEGPILTVSHREGIRELANKGRLKLPYCAIGRFRFDNDAWSLEALFENNGTVMLSGDKTISTAARPTVPAMRKQTVDDVQSTRDPSLFPSPNDDVPS